MISLCVQKDGLKLHGVAVVTKDWIIQSGEYFQSSLSLSVNIIEWEHCMQT